MRGQRFLAAVRVAAVAFVAARAGRRRAGVARAIRRHAGALSDVDFRRDLRQVRLHFLWEYCVNNFRWSDIQHGTLT